MRIAVFAFGSRGDVEPGLALGGRLREYGHDVVVAAPIDSVEFARQTGADVHPINVDAHEFLSSPEGRDMLARGDVRAYVRRMLDKKHEVAPTLHDDLIAAAGSTDVVVGTRLVEEETSSIAEWLGVPFVGLHYAPNRPNGRLPSPLIGTRSLTPLGNRLTYQVAERMLWRRDRPDVNILRGRLHLPKATAPVSVRLAAAQAPEIQAYSRHLVPELAEWDDRRPLVGNLRLTELQRAAIRGDHQDAGLDRWLAADEPPIYYGFGSMPVRDGRKTLDMITEASRRLGTRALVAAGWSDLPRDTTADDGRVRVVAGLDHDRVLPRCRLAVHHGGAGTTAASVGAGLPTVVCSVFADQHFWGQAVARLGIGATMRRSDATAASLTELIKPLLAEDVTLRAKRVAAAMADEDPAGEAARIISAAT
ncbi:glycosyltransferase [Actinoplanes solisilvae]|uniref:glycosyltransferase n=1 Tax=Actinoplanes solisilvae TaxID=2486853 RepID=UPI0013E361DD|nr:glycosyltransferase [Actinoplanes solisilvae]